MDNYTIRKVEEKDCDSLVELYCQVWPHLSSIHQQKAEFVIKHSQGVCFCAEKDGKIVGSRTSFFMPVYYGSRKLNCVQFADSCIHDSCRRQGLFLKLNEAFLHDFFEENNGELVFNISVDASRNAYEKLGWKYIQSLMSFTKVVNPVTTMLKIGFDLRKIHGSTTLVSVENNFEVDNELFVVRNNLLKEQEKIYVNYDYETLMWKLMASKGARCFSIPQLGTVIYKVEKKKDSNLKVIRLGDMFLYDYSIKNIKKMEKMLCDKEMPHLIMGYFSEGHPLFSYYIRKNLFTKVTPLNHGVKVISKEMQDICYNSCNWAISALDIDTF